MQIKKFRGLGVIEVVMSAISIALLISIFFKAIINLDTGYDTGWYHHVFAARIWGIIPKDSFLTEKLVEYRYDGFPLLAHFLQGFLWKITGRVQATNLVGYFSVVVYLFFLRSFFQVPLYLSTIAILTIPSVLIHSTTSYVDLVGNIGASVLTMMSYKLFLLNRLPNEKELIVLFLGATVAANTKPQLQPLVFVIYCVVGIRLVWLYFKYIVSGKPQLWLVGLLATIASALIFITPIKNIVLYGNPFYPIKVQVAGVVLNHKAVPKTYSEGDRPQKWVRSIFEDRTPEWTADQFNYSGNPNILDRGGGFFGAYVVFNLLLLITLVVLECVKKRRLLDHKNDRAVVALAIIVASSIFVANFPQSHELRYFIFWMISLVSINLSCLYSSNTKLFGKRQLSCLSLVYLAFLVVMCIKIDSYYLKPVFESVPLPPRGYTSVKEYIEDAVKPELIEQMIPNERVCLLSGAAIPNPEAVSYASIANAIFYTSYFHSELEYNYAVRAVTDAEGCGDLPMIPHSLSTKINEP